jgi:hypothetical protein
LCANIGGVNQRSSAVEKLCVFVVQLIRLPFPNRVEKFLPAAAIFIRVFGVVRGLTRF